MNGTDCAVCQVLNAVLSVLLKKTRHIYNKLFLYVIRHWWWLAQAKMCVYSDLVAGVQVECLLINKFLKTILSNKIGTESLNIIIPHPKRKHVSHLTSHMYCNPNSLFFAFLSVTCWMEMHCNHNCHIVICVYSTT